MSVSPSKREKSSTSVVSRVSRCWVAVAAIKVLKSPGMVAFAAEPGRKIAKNPSRLLLHRKNRHRCEKGSEGLGSPLAVLGECNTLLQLSDADDAKV